MPEQDEQTNIDEQQAIVIYDGVCKLCNACIQFVIKRDKHNRFIFSPLQSDYAQARLASYSLSGEINETFVLFIDGDYLTQSDAALEICKQMAFPWPILRGFKVLPKKLRDACYRLVARHRYRLFGKVDSCVFPEASVAHKFRR